jgi:hypothetical protein
LIKYNFYCINEAEHALKEKADEFNESNAATVQVVEEIEAEKEAENVIKPGVEEISDEVCNDAEYLEGIQQSIESDMVVLVHAVAAFENSPSDILDQEVG